MAAGCAHRGTASAVAAARLQQVARSLGSGGPWQPASRGQPLRAKPAGTCRVSPAGMSPRCVENRHRARGAGCPRSALGGRPPGPGLRLRSPRSRPREPVTRSDRFKVLPAMRSEAGPHPGSDPSRSRTERGICCAADGAPGYPRGELCWKWEGWGRGTRGATDYPSEPALSAHGR